MKLLIVKTSAIGDIIHTFSAVEYLKSRFPEATVDWVVEKNYKDLVAAHPLISTIHTISTQLWKKDLHRIFTWKQVLDFRKKLQGQTYDILFDLQGNTKSAIITRWAQAKEKVGFGFNSVSEKPNLLVTSHKYEVSKGLNIQDTYLKLVQAHFNDLETFTPQGVELRTTPDEMLHLKQLVKEETPRYLIAFGSRWPNKQLAEETLIKFLELVDQEDRPYFYFIWGSDAERELAVRLHAHFTKSVVLERLSLPLLQAVMRKMDLVISMDSMALHLCGPTPSYSIFGPSLASVYKPLGAQHHHFQGSCPYGRLFSKRCPILRTCATGACLKGASAHHLFEEYQKTKKYV